MFHLIPSFNFISAFWGAKLDSTRQLDSIKLICKDLCRHIKIHKNIARFLTSGFAIEAHLSPDFKLNKNSIERDIPVFSAYSW
jgi:hypothetical protein